MKALLILIFAAANVLHAQEGFYNPGSPLLPPQLKQASESVFEVRTAFIQDHENFSDLIFIDVSSQEKMKEVETKIIEAVPDRRDRTIMLAFLHKCQREGSTSQCYIPTSMSSGSGFITGDGSTFWTNAHNLEKTLKTKAIVNETLLEQLLSSKITLPVFIFDKDGNLLFSGLEEELSFKYTPAPTMLSRMSGNFYAEDSDYLALSLPRRLGQPLKVSTSGRSRGDAIAVIGYPYCTGCKALEGMDPAEFRDRGEGLNAGDCEEKVTGGRLLDTETWAHLAEINTHLAGLLDQNSFVVSTADSHYGMSGGPILNMQGEVVGIHAGNKTVQKYGRYQTYSRGVVPPPLRYENLLP